MTLSVSTVHDWAAAAATTTTTASILALLCISSRPPLLFSTKIDKPLRLLLIRSTGGGGGGKVDWRINKSSQEAHRGHFGTWRWKLCANAVSQQLLATATNGGDELLFQHILGRPRRRRRRQRAISCPHLCNSTKFKRDQHKVVLFPDGPTTSTTLFVALLMVTRRSHRNPKHPPTLWN